MGLDLGKINIKRFADGEIYVQLQESVRGCDVFLLQPTCPPVNENLMELEIMIDACRRASAKNITAVVPYFGYARADRKASFVFVGVVLMIVLCCQLNIKLCVNCNSRVIFVLRINYCNVFIIVILKFHQSFEVESQLDQ